MSDRPKPPTDAMPHNPEFDRTPPPRSVRLNWPGDPSHELGGSSIPPRPMQPRVTDASAPWTALQGVDFAGTVTAARNADARPLAAMLADARADVEIAGKATSASEHMRRAIGRATEVLANLTAHHDHRGGDCGACEALFSLSAASDDWDGARKSPARVTERARDVETLVRLCERLAGALRNVETGGDACTCPGCAAGGPVKERDHAPTCELANALAAFDALTRERSK